MTGCSAAADRLIGALIGLARATEGNEHLISAAATDVVTAALCAEEAEVEALLQCVDAVKREMIPDCYACASPCGRNDAYDMAQLAQEPQEIRVIKLQLLAGIRELARQGCRERFLYKSLIALGIEGYTAEDLQPMLQELEELRNT